MYKGHADFCDKALELKFGSYASSLSEQVPSQISIVKLLAESLQDKEKTRDQETFEKFLAIVKSVATAPPE